MSDWKTIDTAPKDGTWFEGYRPPAPGGWWQRHVICRWDDECQDFIWPSGIFDIYGQDLLEKDERGYFKHDVYEADGSLTHWTPLRPRPT